MKQRNADTKYTLKKKLGGKCDKIYVAEGNSDNAW